MQSGEAGLKRLKSPPKRRAGPRKGDRGIAGRLDASLREAATVEMSAFLVAFDAAVRQQTPDNLGLLRAATDKLLRAAACGFIVSEV